MSKEEKEPQKLNVRIKDGDQFYANETSIQVGPLEIILDFKCNTQVQDIGNNKGLLVKHNPIILSPFHAKSVLNILANSLKNYEEKFGVIKKPKELSKAESMMKKEEGKIKPIKGKSNDSYFG